MTVHLRREGAKLNRTQVFNLRKTRGQNDAVRRHENNKAAREHAESRIGDGAECGTYSRTWKAAAVPTRAEGDSAAAHKFGKPYTAE